MICVILLCAALALGAQTPEWQWAVRAGGTNSEGGVGIAVDSQGNQYVTGSFRDTASFGTTTLTSSGGTDIFICKLDANGNFLWAKQAGGTSVYFDIGNDIAVDSAGNSYVTGYFRDTASFGDTSLISNGAEDIFICKLDGNGNYLWVKQAGGTSNDNGCGIAVDSAGNSFITGDFGGSASFGSITITSSGYSDIFICKLDANGNFLWAQQAGGTGSAGGNAIALDSAGNSYVTGGFEGSASFGATTLISGDWGSAIFACKLDSAGNFLWARQAGGIYSSVSGYGIALDSSGNSYVTGDFDNIASFGATTLTSSGGTDIFICKLNAAGNFIWAKRAGGTEFDEGRAIALDSAGNQYVTGCFRGSASFGATSLPGSGSYYPDIFVCKLNASGNFLWAKQAGGMYGASGNAIAMDGAGNSYVTGSFFISASFGAITLICNGGDDIFVAKLGSGTPADDFLAPVAEFSCHPNPFANQTAIGFNLKASAPVELAVYNLRGQRVQTLLQADLGAGEHSVNWNGRDSRGRNLANGVYFYRLSAGAYTASERVVLLK